MRNVFLAFLVALAVVTVIILMGVIGLAVWDVLGLDKPRGKFS